MSTDRTLIDMLAHAVPRYLPDADEEMKQVGNPEPDWFIDTAVHYYWTKSAHLVLDHYKKKGYVPFYQMNELVANYVVEAFGWQYTGEKFLNAVWEKCMRQQFHNIVYA